MGRGEALFVINETNGIDRTKAREGTLDVPLLNVVGQTADKDRGGVVLAINGFLRRIVGVWFQVLCSGGAGLEVTS